MGECSILKGILQNGSSYNYPGRKNIHPTTVFGHIFVSESLSITNGQSTTERKYSPQLNMNF